LSVVKLPEVVEHLSKPDDFMQAKPRDRQQNMYEVQLEFLCDSRQPLMRLSQMIDRSNFDETFGSLYSVRSWSQKIWTQEKRRWQKL
jgi:hypothetical protein